MRPIFGLSSCAARSRIEHALAALLVASPESRPPGSPNLPPMVRSVTPVRRVVAPNPGPYTGPGTNTWLVDAGTATVVIDPGPDDDKHLDAIQRTLKGSPVAIVLVTHAHPDHLPLAERLAATHRAPVRRFPELADGDVVRAGNLNVTALHTPGHSADHLAFWLANDRGCPRARRRRRPARGSGARARGASRPAFRRAAGDPGGRGSRARSRPASLSASAGWRRGACRRPGRGR